MKFIKLTNSRTRTGIYIRIEEICAFYTCRYGNTIVELKSGIHVILEEPKKIMEMIDNALHESNQK